MSPAISVDTAISSKGILPRADSLTGPLIHSLRDKWQRFFPPDEPRWPIYSFAGLWILELLFLQGILSRDTRPPQWDPASHLTMALDFYFPLHQFQLDRFFKQLLFRPKPYPPLFHCAVAVWYLITGPSHQYAALVNSLFLFVTFLGFYLFGRELRLRDRGWLCAVIFSAFPIVIWMSREALIDLSVISFTLLFAALICSEDFLRDKKATRWSGLVFSLGLLSKQSFVFFAIPILVYRLVQSRRVCDRSVWKKNLMCFSRWASISVVWYILQVPSMIRTALRVHQAALLRSDPMPLTWSGITYYLRMFWQDQANGWILAVLLIGVILAFIPFKHEKETGTHKTFFFIWVLAGYAGITFFVMGKDGRYDMPIVPAVILLAGIGIDRLPGFVWKALVVAVGVLFLGTVGYFSGGPDKTVGVIKFFSSRPMVRLYQCPGIDRDMIEPKNEDWHVEEIIDGLVSRRGLKASIWVGVVPQAQFFNPAAFLYFTRLRRASFQIEDFRLISDVPRALAKMDYLIRKTGDQGPEYATRPNNAIYAYLDAHSNEFTVISSLTLPDGSTADLLEIRHNK
ncbi:MAG: glycosyltransferase family 39 protein [Acidobacteriia bacterium]|nr:glycosyltransferase family 39 protein [Terriglobia bacterium]